MEGAGLNPNQRQALKKLLIPQLGANPSSRVVEPYVGETFSQTLPTASSVSQIADWVIDRLLEQRTPDLMIRAIERLDDETRQAGILLELASELRGHPELWEPAAWPTASVAPLVHWNVPNRNEYFTGRTDLLDTLNRLLNESKTAALTQAITGLGGIGKTQIAVEFCHRNKRAYPGGVFWADASSAGSLTDSYASFALDLGWVSQEMPGDDAAGVWLSRARKTAGWLLVLDNADEPEQIDSLLPQTADGHVLITTRSQDPGWGGKPLAVDVWPLDEAATFLVERTGRKSEVEDCRELAEVLGGLPLALEQAAAYLVQHGTIAVTAYLEGFNRHRVAFMETHKSRRPLRGKYEETVATTWTISFGRLPPPAAEALQALPFLDPDSIPTRFFEKCGDLGSALGALDLGDSFTMAECIVEPLRAYSLIEVFDGGSTFSIHRLVQDVVRYRLTETEASEIFRKVIEILHGLFPKEPDIQVTWKVGIPWLPQIIHSLYLWQKLESKPPWDPTAAWFRAAKCALAAGRYSIARKLCDEVLTIRAYRLGVHHPDTLCAKANLACSLSPLGDLESSRMLLEETLMESRSVLGAEHKETLTLSVNLSVTHLNLGNAALARDLLERSRKAICQILGREHKLALAATANLAHSYLLLGDAASARGLLEESLGIRTELLGPEHPDTLSGKALLASALSALGESISAHKLLQETLEVSRCVLGTTHPYTLWMIHDLLEISREARMIVDERLVEELLSGCQEPTRKYGYPRGGGKSVGKHTPRGRPREGVGVYSLRRPRHAKNSSLARVRVRARGIWSILQRINALRRSR